MESQITSMLNRTKTKEILKGSELLKVASLQKPILIKSRKVLLSIVTTIYVLSLGYGVYITKDEPQNIQLYLLVGLTMLYAMVFYLTFVLRSAKENALIITENGIAYWPIVAEKWEDIESYTWEEFKGLRRVPGPTALSSCEGTTLRLINKGFFQRCLEGRTGHSIFATYLIFFSPEQIATTDDIIKQHGIQTTS